MPSGVTSFGNSMANTFVGKYLPKKEMGVQCDIVTYFKDEFAEMEAKA
jgi:hypothetical protein